MGIFGSKPAAAAKPAGGEILDRDRAVLDLKVSRDKCKKYMARLESEADALKAKAAALLKEGKRDKALLMLKLRKYRTLSREKAMAQLLQLEEMTAQVESAAATAAVFEGIQAGNAVLQEIHASMDAVAVEAAMDDLREATELQAELQLALGGPLGAAEEADAEAEYEAMMVAEEAAEAAAVAAALPDAPAGLTEAEQAAVAAGVAAQLPVAPSGPVAADPAQVRVEGVAAAAGAGGGRVAVAAS